MANISVFVPEDGAELCVQDGRPRGSCGLRFPAKPSFDHAKPDSPPLAQGEWDQFQAEVQKAIAGMKSERALWCFMAVVLPGCFIGIVLLQALNGDFGLWFISLFFLGAASVVITTWIPNCNLRQDKIIGRACLKLRNESGGRLTARYDTFNTIPWLGQIANERAVRQPHRVIVIFPSEPPPVLEEPSNAYVHPFAPPQDPPEAIPVAVGVVAQPAEAVVAQPAEVVPGAHGALVAQAVVVQQAQVAHAEEP
jgi:hypothetical protein